MAASRSFPSDNNQVIRNYQGVMVRVRQNMPMCLPSRAPVEKDIILRELKTYFPTQYLTVSTNVSESEEPDSISDLIAQMPYLVVDKIKSYQRVNMTTDKKHINIEIRYLATM